MKKLTLLLLSLITLLAGLAFRLEKPVLLRLDLKKGSTYLYKTTFTQNITTQVAGKDIHAKMNMESAMNLNVIQKYKADSILLKARYNFLVINIAARGTESTFDSRDTTSTNSKQLGSFVNAMKTNPIIIKTNSLGQVLDIRGLDKVQKAAGGSNNPSLQKLMNNILNKKTFKHYFTNLGIFPEKPVSVGDHWERMVSTNNIAPLNINTVYTVRDIQRRNVILDVSSKISSSKDSVTINGFTIPAHVTGAQTGTYTIERSTGLISEGNLNQNVAVKMSMMGQNVTININGKYNIAENPAK